MEQHCQNEPVLALHGTQVGIGTLVSAFTLNRLIEIERQQQPRPPIAPRPQSRRALDRRHKPFTRSSPTRCSMSSRLNQQKDAVAVRQLR